MLLLLTFEQDSHGDQLVYQLDQLGFHDYVGSMPVGWSNARTCASVLWPVAGSGVLICPKHPH